MGQFLPARLGGGVSSQGGGGCVGGGWGGGGGGGGGGVGFGEAVALDFSSSRTTWRKILM